MPRRIEQLSHALRDAVGTYLRTAVEFPPDTLVTVTRTDVSRDTHAATIFVSVLPEAQSSAALATLRQELFDIQGAANRALGRRVCPRIQFALDPQTGEPRPARALEPIGGRAPSAAA